MNCFVNKHELPSSVCHLNLELKNEKQLNKLTKSQKEHLNEVFVHLLNFSQINGSRRAEYGLSSRVEVKRLASGLVRVFDPYRENLDVNCVLEMCIDLMSNPFAGHLTHLESDFSQFECVSKAALSVEYRDQMQKIYRATGRVEFHFIGFFIEIKTNRILRQILNKFKK
jgi:hypothetical protein